MGMGQQNPPDCTESPKYKTASAGKKFRPPQKRLGETGAVYYNKREQRGQPSKSARRKTRRRARAARWCCWARTAPRRGGMCAAAVPAVFQIQGRVSVVQAQPRTPAEEAGAFDAANGCPVNAIRARKA